MQSIIGQIGIFMICAQTIMHFRPKEAYGKYIRLLFSVMILIQIIQPFLNLFFDGTGVEMQKSVQEFERILDESMEEAISKAAASEDQLEQMSLGEMEKRLAEQGMEYEEKVVEENESRIAVEPIEQISIAP